MVHAGRGWLGVLDPTLANNQVGWVRFDPAALPVYLTEFSLHVDLAGRSVTLVCVARGLFSFPVAIGRPDAQTPPGRFAITDKLNVTQRGSVYGCCIVALSGHQPNLPPGWIGGDRIALHGTPA